MADEVVVDTAAEMHRAQAVECNNGIWDLVGGPRRVREMGRG